MTQDFVVSNTRSERKPPVRQDRLDAHVQTFARIAPRPARGDIDRNAVRNYVEATYYALLMMWSFAPPIRPLTSTQEQFFDQALHSSANRPHEVVEDDNIYAVIRPTIMFAEKNVLQTITGRVLTGVRRATIAPMCVNMCARARTQPNRRPGRTQDRADDDRKAAVEQQHRSGPAQEPDGPFVCTECKTKHGIFAHCRCDHHNICLRCYETKPTLAPPCIERKFVSCKGCNRRVAHDGVSVQVCQTDVIPYDAGERGTKLHPTAVDVSRGYYYSRYVDPRNIHGGGNPRTGVSDAVVPQFNMNAFRSDVAE